MKILFYTIIVLLVNVSLAFAQVTDPEAQKYVEEGIKEHDAGNFEKAIELYEKALALEPGNEGIIYEIAYSYFELKDYTKTVSLVEDEIAKGEVKNLDLFVLLGNTYDVMGDPDKSIATYKKGLELFPGSGYIYYNYGITLAGKKEYEEALEKFEKGIAVEPDYASNFYMASKLLADADHVWSILYAEMYINLQTSNKRSSELSSIILNYYKDRIKKTDDGYSVNINPLGSMSGEVSLPGRYEMLMMISVAALHEYGTTIDGFAHLRVAIAEIWNEKNDPALDNIVFDRAKQISAVNKDYPLCYNYLMLAFADQNNFEKWYAQNEDLFDSFIDWFAKNPLEFTPSSKYYRGQYN